MRDYHRHTLFNNLDHPPKILIFSVGEFFTLIAPFFIGLLTGHFLICILVGGVAFYALKKIKKKITVNARQIFYWHFCVKTYRATPPSHQREYWG